MTMANLWTVWRLCTNPSIGTQPEDGIAKVRDMTKTYLNSGGMEIQYNIVSSDTMRAAQADPETYRDLVVRIAGFSAYFVELSLDCQNDLISRTENYL
jgi:formate C-acetyltransferase